MYSIALHLLLIPVLCAAAITAIPHTEEGLKIFKWIMGIGAAGLIASIATMLIWGV
jgi:hypothetical protein